MSFKILLVGVLAVSGWHVLANDLSARGKPMLNTWAIGISVSLNIFLNILWIPKWGINGAAFATTISYLVMFVVTIIFYTKISGNKTRDIILLKKDDFKFYKEIMHRIFGRS
jgi:Na+-driven multidrug efflux pump